MILICFPSIAVTQEKSGNNASESNDSTKPSANRSQEKPTSKTDAPTKQGQAPREALAKSLEDYLQDRVLLFFSNDQQLSPFLKDAASIMIPRNSLDKFLADKLAERQGGDRQGVVTSVNVTGTLESSLANLDMLITINTTAANSKVELRLNEMQIQKASDHQGGTPVLERASDGTLSVLLDRPGQWTLHLTATASIKPSSSERRIQLSLPNAPVKKVELRSQEPIAWARQRHDGLTSVPCPIENNTNLLPLIDNTQSLDVSFQTQKDQASWVSAANSIDAILIARKTTTGIRVNGQATIEATGKSRDWEFELPDGMTMQSVTYEQGTRRGSVAVRPLPKANPIVNPKVSVWQLRFDEIPLGKTKLEFELAPTNASADLSQLELVVPMLRACPVQRGLILVTAPTGNTLTFQHQVDVQRIGVEALSSDLTRHQPRAAFRYVAAPSTLGIEWVKANPELSSSQEVELRLRPDGSELRSSITLSARKSSLGKLTLIVPKELVDVRVRSPRGADIDAIATIADSNNKRIDVSLREQSEGDIELNLTGQLPKVDNAPSTFTLPSIVGTRASSGLLLVHSPTRDLVTFHLERSTGLLRRSDVDLANPPTGTSARRDSESLAAFQIQSNDAKITLSSQSIPNVVSASRALTLTFRNSKVQVHEVMMLTSRFDPLERVSIALPSKIGQVVTRSPMLVQQERSGNDLIVKLRGDKQQRIELTYDAVIPTAASTTNIALPVSSLAAVVWDTQQLEIIDHASKSYVPDDDWLESTWSNNPGTPAPHGIHRYSRQGECKQIMLKVLPGVIRQGEVVRAMVDLVLDRTGQQLGIVRFVCKRNSGMMSFDLPAQTRLLSVNLNGKAVRVSQESPRAIDILMSPGDDAETSVANNGDRDRPAHDDELCLIEMVFQRLSSPMVGIRGLTELEVPWPTNVLVSASVWHVRTHGDLLTRTASQVSHMQANSYWTTSRATFEQLDRWLFQQEIPTFWSRTDSVAELRGGTDLASTIYQPTLPVGSLSLIWWSMRWWLLICSMSLVVFVFTLRQLLKARLFMLVGAILCLGILSAYFFVPSGSWLILGIMPGIGFLVLTGLVHLILKRQDQKRVVVLPSGARVSALSSSQPQTSWWRSWLAKLLARGISTPLADKK